MLECRLPMAEKGTTENSAAENDSAVLRVYEIGYHISPAVKEEDVEKVAGVIRAAIEQASGSFIAEGAPSLTKLYYAISVLEGGKHVEYDRAYFGWLKFEAPSTAVAVIEAALRVEKQVMRHIIFQTVREDTRARAKMGSLREVRREGAVAKTVSPKREEETAAPVSEEDLDKAISGLTD